ncbi:MAG TPA: metal-dependent hydrolase [Gemmatimonadaceae bacterium]|nr:metal-dependent hydrolase [Gemmatimonadaceae bacterium]
MPSIFSHAVAAAAIGAALGPARVPARCLVGGALLAALPDADVAGFALGVRYQDMLGHRGLSHSLAFAAAAALVATALVRGADHPRGSRRWLLAYFFLATASHGVLDGFTNGGLGVAFWAPFDGRRYFFPFRPIQVSPIGVGAFFTRRGARVIASELVWIWAPSMVVMLVAWWRWRRALTPRVAPPSSA